VAICRDFLRLTVDRCSVNDQCRALSRRGRYAYEIDELFRGDA